MKTICFGEIMLRLNPPSYDRFAQATSLMVNPGGGEANVAVSLANYGMDAAFVTKLPTHEIGQLCVNALRGLGVDTSMIVRGGERVGLYYLEKGASVRPSKVIYDRKYSSVSMADASDFDWDTIFADATWFHFTGITPALGENVAKITLDACRAAKAKNITISCDLNYRKNLWSCEEAGKVMGEIMKYVDVCIANEEDAEKVFGIKAEDTDVDKGVVNHDAYKSVAKQLSDRFGCKYVAITLRESISANDNNWAAMLYNATAGTYSFSRKYPIHIVDRVGGGDSFGGGLIYAIQNNYSDQDVIEFAVAASALKHTIEGDFNLVSKAEVDSLLKNGGSGRVQR